jgi:hypothetical protein
MTSQADAFHYAGKVLDAAEAWQRGDQPSTWQALDGVPVAHIALGLLTLTDLLAEELSTKTGVPAQRLLMGMRTEMLKGEHGE